MYIFFFLADYATLCVNEKLFFCTSIHFNSLSLTSFSWNDNNDSFVSLNRDEYVFVNSSTLMPKSMILSTRWVWQCRWLTSISFMAKLKFDLMRRILTWRISLKSQMSWESGAWIQTGRIVSTYNGIRTMTTLLLLQKRKACFISYGKSKRPKTHLSGGIRKLE